jgi:hypothetical protein
MQMPTSKYFEETHPNTCRFVNENGCIEIGQSDMTSAFVKAYDEGGTVYEGQDSYPSPDAALQDLDAGIKEYTEKWGI